MSIKPTWEATPKYKTTCRGCDALAWGTPSWGATQLCGFCMISFEFIYTPLKRPKWCRDMEA